MVNDTETILPAILSSTLIETLLVGVFLPLCIKTYVVLHLKQTSIRKTMLAITTGQLLFILTHWSINLYRLFGGFINSPPLPSGAQIYFSKVYDPKYVAGTGIYIALGLLDLSLLTYRLYVIWECNFWICIPSCLSMLSLSVSGIGVCISLSRLRLLESVWTSAAQPWVLGSTSSRVFTTSYCVCMISYRILANEQVFVRTGVIRLSSSSVGYAVRIMIDSAALCLIPNISLLVVYLQNSTFALIPEFAEVPLIGIAYCLIVIRADGKRDKDAFRRRQNFFGQSTVVFRKNETSTYPTTGSIPMDIIVTKQVTEEITDIDPMDSDIRLREYPNDKLGSYP